MVIENPATADTELRLVVYNFTTFGSNRVHAKESAGVFGQQSHVTRHQSPRPLTTWCAALLVNNSMPFSVSRGTQAARRASRASSVMRLEAQRGETGVVVGT